MPFVPNAQPGSPLLPAGIIPGQDGIMPNGISVPTDFPYINITTSNNADPQYIFIDNRGGGGDPWNVIFDNSGQPVWYSKYPDERRDMKVQPNGVLTMLAHDEGGDHFNGFNTNYEKIAEYWTTNGYIGDEHELQVLADVEGPELAIALHGSSGGGAFHQRLRQLLRAAQIELAGGEQWQALHAI